MNRFSIPSTFELSNEIALNNPNFHLVKVRIMSSGENYNGSSFTINSLNNAKNGVAYSPILANVVKDENEEYDFGGHDINYTTKIDYEGNVTFEEEYIEKPVGVFLNNSTEIKFDEENSVNYIQAYGIIWDTYSKTIDILRRDGVKDVSVEIECLQGEMRDDGYFEIQEYNILGTTLLGGDNLPAIEGSKIEMCFSRNKEYEENLKEIDKILQKFALEGGDNMDEEKVQVEQEVEEPTVEQEEVEEAIEIPVIVEEQGEVEEEMACGTKKKKKKCAEGEDDEDVCPKCGKPMSECECDDEEDDEEDMACGGKKKKKKCSADEEDELEPEEICTSCGEPLAKCKCMEDREKAKEEAKKDKKYSQEELDEAIANVRAEYAQIMEELEGLREFKAEYDRQIEIQQLEQSMDEIASNFNVEESIVKELREKVLSGEYSMDKFELELYRNNAPIKKEFSKKENKLPVIDNEKKTSEIDAFFNKYLRK